MDVKFLDLWNDVPVELSKYLGILPYLTWVESNHKNCLYIGFLNYAIVFTFDHKKS